MAKESSGTRTADGTLDFSGGVDSGRVTTISSPANPNGLQRNQLAWSGNCTVRGGGVGQRTTWQPRVKNAAWSGKFQCAYMYEVDNDNPYMILSIGGRIYQCRVDTDYSVTDLSGTFGLTNPANILPGFMCQGERFLVIQAGDNSTLPLFWDGTTLKRSNGFVAFASPNNQLPAAGPMDYYMGRLWYANGREYCAGDIVGSQVSGHAPFDYTDSILYTTENPISKGGDAFIVPTNAGDIRALKHSANLNTALGEGQLYVFTRKSIYATTVPALRADWSTLSEPLQRVAQIDYGAVGDKCVVPVNGDLFYQAVDGIRSLDLAIRYFDQWGNTPLSRNETRILRFNDRNLLRFASGILFDNRMLQTAYPFETDSGIAHKAIIPLDFDLISSFEQKLPPAWEGIWDGVSVLQLLEGDFGGRQRAFAVVVSELTGQIEVWELTDNERFEDGDNRVKWFIETPSYTWGDEFALKELDGLEVWIDKLFGTVDFEVYFIPDQYPCPIFWHRWQECAARSCQEDTTKVFPVDCIYPVQNYREQFRANVTLPAPPTDCDPILNRPHKIGYQFRFLIAVTGWCRIRGLLAYSLPRQKGVFEGIRC